MLTHMRRYGFVMLGALLLLCAAAGADDAAWKNPLKKRGYLKSPLIEVTPFVLNDQLYLMESWRTGLDWPGEPGDGKAADNNEIWIASLPKGPEDYAGRKYVSRAFEQHALASAIVWENRVYVFAVNETSGRKQVDVTWSQDLKTWSKPLKVLQSPAGSIFNVAITRDADGFAFMWETDGAGTPFTMCYGRVKKLTDNWNDGIIEGAVYGRDKYTGGPALYFEGSWYYTLYLESLGGSRYETRITRSRDLKQWHDAPAGRPFVTFDPSKTAHPLQKPDVRESNASDAELCFHKGRTIVYFTGGNQQVAGDLQWATFDGKPQQLFETFFDGVADPAAAKPPAKPKAADTVDFVRDVQPIFAAHCTACHGSDKQKSGLRLDVKSLALKGGDHHAPSIVPGKSKQSPLIQFVTGEDEDMLMPPKGKRLSQAEIATLSRWIDQGAHWSDGVDTAKVHDRRDHWAFKPLADPALATTKNTTWARNGVDRFILARLEREGLSPAPDAERPVWLRRVYLSLTGLPPTPQQVRAFAADPRDDAHARVVDELLASPRYGERWGQHWLDVIRYADTDGFEVNTPRNNAWPYRDYVIRAFNDDKPYDRFILEQLAGDAVEADEATGFMVAAAALLPGQIGQDDVSKRQARQDALDEIIVGTSGALLGLTVGCARCHDHKFDPITQRDYYTMQAFFAGVEYGDRPVNTAERRQRIAEAAALAPRIDALDEQLRRFEPLAFAGRSLIIDEEDAARVTVLKKPNGPGTNPGGKQRGYRDDVGAADRAGNLSRGRYTWWNNVPGEDVLTYNPGLAGRFRLWLSWGVHGSGTHTRDARYILDRDGDLATRDDQRELAQADQYYFAGVTQGQSEHSPLWSGLLDVGVVELTESSKVVLRGGQTGTGITADVIVLQEADGETGAGAAADLPRLRGPAGPLHNVEHIPAATAKFVRFTTLETIDDNRHEPCIDELEVFAAGGASRNLALDSAGGVATSSGNYSDIGIHQLKHINDGKYGNGQSWISNERGGGWVQIELKEVAAIDRVVWGRDREGKFKDRLPVRYRIEISLDGKAWQQVASHADRLAPDVPHDPLQALLRHRPKAAPGTPVAPGDIVALADELKRLREEKARLEAPQMVFAGAFRTPDPTYLLRRGDPERRAGTVPPAVPDVFNSSVFAENTPEQERRLALARWIASPDNPLTARVMVNRIWQYHFGVGLVATANDFGLNGVAPSHPELLDWLARQFIASGWSVKHIQRLITISATFRQSSRIEPAAAAVDRDNRLLWRFPSRRVEAEAIRDSMLAVTGELNLKMGGAGFNFFKSRGGLDGFPPVDKFGPEELRRMVYAHKVRMEQVPVFGAFDCPDAGQMMPRRSQSTTAIQALNLFNSDFVAERAEALAARIKALAPAGVDAQVTLAFELTLGRPPTPVELAAATQVVRDHGLTPLGRVLFNSSEFLFLP